MSFDLEDAHTTLCGDAVLRVTRAEVDLTLEVALKRGEAGCRLLIGVCRDPVYFECASPEVLATALANILPRGWASTARRATAELRAFMDRHPAEWNVTLVNDGAGDLWTKVWVPADRTVQAAAQLVHGWSWTSLGIVRRGTGGSVVGVTPWNRSQCITFWNTGDPVEQVRRTAVLAGLAPDVADVNNLHLTMTDLLRRLR